MKKKKRFVHAKAVCIYPTSVPIRSEPAVTIKISLGCISPNCRLHFSFVHYPKKLQTQNLRWSLKILRTTYQTRQRSQLKSFVRKAYCESINEIDFTEIDIQILHHLEIAQIT